MKLPAASATRPPLFSSFTSWRRCMAVSGHRLLRLLFPSVFSGRGPRPCPVGGRAATTFWRPNHASNPGAVSLLSSPPAASKPRRPPPVESQIRPPPMQADNWTLHRPPTPSPPARPRRNTTCSLRRAPKGDGGTGRPTAPRPRPAPRKGFPSRRPPPLRPRSTASPSPAFSEPPRPVEAGLVLRGPDGRSPPAVRSGKLVSRR